MFVSCFRPDKLSGFVAKTNIVLILRAGAKLVKYILEIEGSTCILKRCVVQEDRFQPILEPLDLPLAEEVNDGRKLLRVEGILGLAGRSTAATATFAATQGAANQSHDQPEMSTVSMPALITTDPTSTSP